MSELIYSVEELFTDFLEANKQFNIPDYQRGYKWDADDIRKLLDDLQKFEDSSPNEEAFYCLQNITLIQDGKMLNVVDGQQRLTTLYILLSYYKNVKNEEFPFKSEILKYSIRSNTAERLKSLYENKEIWSSLNPSNVKHRDEFYILTVAQAIQGWFENKQLNFDIIWKKTQLIVNKLDNKIEEEKEEKVFANINGGKVPLDGADLVRAVLITKSAKEKSPEKQKINEFRVRMGMEIDEMNRWWDTKDVQDYYQQFLPSELEREVSFNQKEYPISLLYKIFYEINQNSDNENKKISFDFFEYGVDFDSEKGNDYYEMYKEILSLHLTLKDWFNHQEIYHLLGYLFFNFKQKVSLKEIWHKKWKASTTKSDFINKLKELVSSNLEDLVQTQKGTSEKREELLAKIENISEDWYNSQDTLKLLLLMDVVYFIDKKTDRLPVPYFKAHDEDKEHIMCQHPREEEEQISSCDARSFLEHFFNDEQDEKIEVTSFIEELQRKEGEKLSAEEQKKFDDLLHRYSLNSIGNIVLLNKQVNRSYKNAPHNEKITRIVSEFFGNKHYIRPFTAAVFLEKDSTEIKKEFRWGIKEIEANAKKNISEQISKFLGWRK